MSAAHNDLSANGDPEPQLLTSAESAICGPGDTGDHPP